MATRTKSGSVFATGVRVTRLAAAGAPTVGADNAYLTDNLVRIEFTIEYRDDEEKERTNGQGKTCLYYSAPGSVQRLTINALELCYPDAELEALLGGGDVLVDADGDPIGYAAPAVGTYADPVSIEAWSSAMTDDGIDADFPYLRWLFPWERLRHSGSRALEVDPMAAVFEGTGKQNQNWGTGPFDDWEYESSRVYQVIRSATIPDLSVNGFVAVPAPTP